MYSISLGVGSLSQTSHYDPKNNVHKKVAYLNSQQAFHLLLIQFNINMNKINYMNLMGEIRQ